MDGLFFFKQAATAEAQPAGRRAGKGVPAPRDAGDAETLAALRLARSRGVGPVLWRRLVDRFGSASAALEAWPDLARQHKLPAPIFSQRDAERELATLQRLGGRLLVLGQPDYPVLLAQIADPPPVLGLLGDASALSQAPVAIVGARNASLNGRALAEGFATALAASGRVVVSGLARGIDTAAHRGALAAPVGPGAATVAVLAGGLDRPYPPENLDLLERVVERGAAISEVALGIAPTARHFPRRNRIIAGLAQGVVVVEAALRSGSLITARLANEQGREVMAVPGSPLDERCRGCNALLRDGASLIETPADILAALPAFAPPVSASRPKGKPSRLRSRVACNAQVPPPTTPHELVHLLGAAPTSIDELVRRSGLPAGTVSDLLLELELAGRLERHAGNAVSVL